MNYSKSHIFYEIYEVLKPLLNTLGPISTKAIWNYYQEASGKYEYRTVASAFKDIMATMIEQKKATQVNNSGGYIIHRENERVKKEEGIDAVPVNFAEWVEQNFSKVPDKSLPPKKKICPDCEGKGRVYGGYSKGAKCTKCKGRGYVKVSTN